MGWQDGTPVDSTQKPSWMQGSMASQIPIDANQGQAAPESVPQATILGDIAAGSTNFQRRLRRGLVDTGSLLGGPILKRALGFMNPTDAEMAESAAKVKQGGPLADIAQITGDVGANLLLAPAKLPMTAVQGARTLPLALNAIREPLKQAAYNAAVVPEGEKTTAAAIAGAAPAVAPLVTGPLKKLLTPEAQLLKDAGVDISPSVAITGENQQGGAALASGLIRTLRNKAKWVPGMGDVITTRNNKMLNQGAVAKVNEVLAPLDVKLNTNLPVKEALDKALKVIDDSYEAAKPGLYIQPKMPIAQPFTIPHQTPGLPPEVVPPQTIKAMTYDVISHYADSPTMRHEGIEEVRDAASRLIFKALDHAESNGVQVSGKVWKEIDSTLNHLSEINLAKTTDASAVAKGEAYKGLQDLWYHVVRESQPGAKALVRKADESFARLQPVAKAAESVMNGPWNPARMHNVNTRAKIEASPLDKALQSAMGDLKYSHNMASGGASSGAAAAKMAGLAGIGEAAQMYGLHGPDATTVLPLLGGGALGAWGLGSKGGMGYLTRGVNPAIEYTQDLISKLRKKPKAPYNEAEMDEFLRSLTQQATAEYGRK